MSTKIFVNLPVNNLDRSITFFTQMGFSFNEQFTDATAACMVIKEDIYATLLTHAKFKEFTPKEKQVADATKTTEVLTCLSFDSKEKVNQLVTGGYCSPCRSNRGKRPPGLWVYVQQELQRP
jgi:hypothetical protein